VLAWEDSRLDQITTLFEQVFSRQVQENLAESVTQIVESVIDIASSNIDEVRNFLMASFLYLLFLLYFMHIIYIK
jgi:hypothetical protein